MSTVKERKNFSKIVECMDIPVLVEIQTDSYSHFLQLVRTGRKRRRQGLEAAFQDCFPIQSFDGSCRLEYVGYELGKPKYPIAECHKRGMTYAAPLKVRLRLVKKGEQKEQEVYMGELPLMTPTGTFIINGAERVVVSQLHRSPGVSLEVSMHQTGKRVFSVRVIPYRGAWLEFECDINNVLYAYIDRRRKILATTLLRSLGFSTNFDILKSIYEIRTITDLKRASFQQLSKDILADDVHDKSTNELIGTAGVRLTKDLLDFFVAQNVQEIKVASVNYDDYCIVNTLERDPYHNADEAQLAIYKRIRPGDPPTLDNASDLIKKLFFDEQRYDLGKVGRFMLNRKLSLDVPLDVTVLRPEDVLHAVDALLKLKNGVIKIDDIDHLGNRRVRSVGELLQNQVRVGLARMKRATLERMSIYNLDAVMPHNLINPKLVSTAIKDFFGRSQLSQFMDQTNPLAELTHKRRLSALGPGGLSRERAGFEVRDVHPSHYGRICPIETPEGPNIGLIASLEIFCGSSREVTSNTEPSTAGIDSSMPSSFRAIRAILFLTTTPLPALSLIDWRNRPKASTDTLLKLVKNTS